MTRSFNTLQLLSLPNSFHSADFELAYKAIVLFFFISFSNSSTVFIISMMAGFSADKNASGVMCTAGVIWISLLALLG